MSTFGRLLTALVAMASMGQVHPADPAATRPACQSPAGNRIGRPYYPVILVHGWNSDSRIWEDSGLLSSLRDAGWRIPNTLYLEGSRIDIHLNYNPASTDWEHDVQIYERQLLPDQDLYVVNFRMRRKDDKPFEDDYSILSPLAQGSNSNTSALAKQAAGISKAVKKVLEITQNGKGQPYRSPAQKKVILVGTSMGGMAIRSYLQELILDASGNPTTPIKRRWWQQGQVHHVAGVVTIASPHHGAKMASLLGNTSWVLWSALKSILPQFGTLLVHYHSEAFRDLSTDNPAIKGGDESSVPSRFHNSDVNCDGDTNDAVPSYDRDLGTVPSTISFVTVRASGMDALKHRWVPFVFPPEHTSTDGVLTIEEQTLPKKPNLKEQERLDPYAIHIGGLRGMGLVGLHNLLFVSANWRRTYSSQVYNKFPWVHPVLNNTDSILDALADLRFEFGDQQRRPETGRLISQPGFRPTISIAAVKGTGANIDFTITVKDVDGNRPVELAGVPALRLVVDGKVYDLSDKVFQRVSPNWLTGESFKLSIPLDPGNHTYEAIVTDGIEEISTGNKSVGGPPQAKELKAWFVDANGSAITSAGVGEKIKIRVQGAFNGIPQAGLQIRFSDALGTTFFGSVSPTGTTGSNGFAESPLKAATNTGYNQVIVEAVGQGIETRTTVLIDCSTGIKGWTTYEFIGTSAQVHLHAEVTDSKGVGLPNVNVVFNLAGQNYPGKTGQRGLVSVDGPRLEASGLPFSGRLRVSPASGTGCSSYSSIWIPKKGIAKSFPYFYGQATGASGGIAFSPDGKSLATASGTTLEIWDLSPLPSGKAALSSRFTSLINTIDDIDWGPAGIAAVGNKAMVAFISVANGRYSLVLNKQRVPTGGAQGYYAVKQVGSGSDLIIGGKPDQASSSSKPFLFRLNPYNPSNYSRYSTSCFSDWGRISDIDSATTSGNWVAVERNGSKSTLALFRGTTPNCVTVDSQINDVYGCAISADGIRVVTVGRATQIYGVNWMWKVSGSGLTRGCQIPSLNNTFAYDADFVNNNLVVVTSDKGTIFVDPSTCSLLYQGTGGAGKKIASHNGKQWVATDGGPGFVIYSFAPNAGPAVSFIQPVTGSVFVGNNRTIDVVVSAVDPDGVRRVDCRVDPTGTWQPLTQGQAPYWKGSVTVSGIGSHTLQVRAFDCFEYPPASFGHPPMSITINLVADKIGPSISDVKIAPPQVGYSPPGSVSVSAKVQDPSGVRSVVSDFKLGGKTVPIPLTRGAGDVWSGSFSGWWAEGLYEVWLTATDAATATGNATQLAPAGKVDVGDPPVIGQVGVAPSTLHARDTAVFSVDVKDDTGIAEVRLHYKLPGSTAWGSTRMGSLGSERYGVRLGPLPHSGSLLFYIEASDTLRHVAKTPEQSRTIVFVVSKVHRISPDHGGTAGGEKVSLLGSGLRTDTDKVEVFFDTVPVPASSIRIVDDYTITLFTPKALKAGVVSVTVNIYKKSGTTTATQKHFLPNAFTYLDSVDVSGVIFDDQMIGQAGVSLGGFPKSVVTGVDGSYSTDVRYGWSGTITPQKDCYEFSPPSRNYQSLTSSQRNQNFLAISACVPSVLYTFRGDSVGQEYGKSVSGAGDVNKDGYADLIVAAPGDDNKGYRSGSASVFSGTDGKILYTFNGDSAYDHFGSSVSGAGDVNKDGYADLIVGAPGDDNNGVESGSARVLSGKDGSILYTFNGDSVGDYFGFSASGAGDVNKDGYADLIVGAYGDDNNNRVNSGSARVFSGKDGSILFYAFDGDSAGDNFGYSVSGAGDVNKDSYPDLIVGAQNGGKNGGGYARVLSGKDGSILYTFNGDSAGDHFGRSVSGAGDVNKDGYADLIVGASDANYNYGSARVLSGKDGSILYTFNGDSAYDHFGSSVSGAGDVNKDGYADVIVGAFYDDNNGSESGSARVLSGKDGAILYTFNGDSVNDRFGRSVSGAGDVNQDGYADLIAGVDHFSQHKGYARVVSGAKLLLTTDTHVLSLSKGGTQTFDLRAGSANFGRLYWIFGSATGTIPGITLSSVHIPLNPDPYTDITIGMPGLNPPFLRFKGTLDSNGEASASFNVPLGLPALLDFTLYHAYVVYTAQGNFYVASNPVPVTLKN